MKSTSWGGEGRRGAGRAGNGDCLVQGGLAEGCWRRKRSGEMKTQGRSKGRAFKEGREGRGASGVEAALLSPC